MPQIAWVKTYDAAVKAARASKKLILVDFYADW
jgi:thiol:disulfide interchange protein